MSGSCDHNGGVLTSEDGSLKLSVSKFYIATSFYGPFVLPLRCDVISLYYWIGVSELYHFYKPVQVEFEHFAVVTACNIILHIINCCLVKMMMIPTPCSCSLLIMI